MAIQMLCLESTRMATHFFVNFGISNGCVLLTIGPTYQIWGFCKA